MRSNIPLSLVILIMISLLASGCATPGAQLSTETVGSLPGNNIPTSTPDPTTDPIIISKVESSAGLETIYVTNISNISVDITGFSLLVPNTTEHFDFPETKLEPGTSLKIYNGPDAKLMTDGLFWRDQFVLKIPGDYVILLNHAGRVIWNYSKSPN